MTPKNRTSFMHVPQVEINNINMSVVPRYVRTVRTWSRLDFEDQNAVEAAEAYCTVEKK